MQQQQGLFLMVPHDATVTAMVMLNMVCTVDACMHATGCALEACFATSVCVCV